MVLPISASTNSLEHSLLQVSQHKLSLIVAIIPWLLYGLAINRTKLDLSVTTGDNVLLSIFIFGLVNILFVLKFALTAIIKRNPKKLIFASISLLGIIPACIILYEITHISFDF